MTHCAGQRMTTLNLYKAYDNLSSFGSNILVFGMYGDTGWTGLLRIILCMYFVAQECMSTFL